MEKGFEWVQLASDGEGAVVLILESPTSKYTKFADMKGIAG